MRGTLVDHATADVRPRPRRDPPGRHRCVVTGRAGPPGSRIPPRRPSSHRRVDRPVPPVGERWGRQPQVGPLVPRRVGCSSLVRREGRSAGVGRTVLRRLPDRQPGVPGGLGRLQRARGLQRLRAGRRDRRRRAATPGRRARRGPRRPLGRGGRHVGRRRRQLDDERSLPNARGAPAGAGEPPGRCRDHGVGGDGRSRRSRWALRPDPGAPRRRGLRSAHLLAGSGVAAAHLPGLAGGAPSGIAQRRPTPWPRCSWPGPRRQGGPSTGTPTTATASVRLLSRGPPWPCSSDREPQLSARWTCDERRIRTPGRGRRGRTSRAGCRRCAPRR